MLVKYVLPIAKTLCSFPMSSYYCRLFLLSLQSWALFFWVCSFIYFFIRIRLISLEHIFRLFQLSLKSWKPPYCLFGKLHFTLTDFFLNHSRSVYHHFSFYHLHVSAAYSSFCCPLFAQLFLNLSLNLIPFLMPRAWIPFSKSLLLWKTIAHAFC